MRNDDLGWFRQTLAGALFGMLLMAGFPAVASQVGDALALGEVNRIDDRTDLKGKAKGANLQIKNTGNSSALAAKADRQAIVARAADGPVAVNAKADRVAIKIKVDDGFPPIKVNPGAGTAKNLSADRLDGLDSTEIRPVAARAQGDQFEVFAEGPAVARSVSLTAPSDGVVIVHSSAMVVDTIEGDYVTCSITTGTTVDADHEQLWQSGGVGGGDSAQLAGTRGFDVVAGLELAVNLVCDEFGGGGFIIRDSALTALFVPTG